MGFVAAQQQQQLGKQLSVDSLAIVSGGQQNGDTNPLVTLMQQLRLEIESKDAILVHKEDSLNELRAQLRQNQSELLDAQKKMVNATAERVKNYETVSAASKNNKVHAKKTFPSIVYRSMIYKKLLPCTRTQLVNWKWENQNWKMNFAIFDKW